MTDLNTRLYQGLQTTEYPDIPLHYLFYINSNTVEASYFFLIDPTPDTF